MIQPNYQHIKNEDFNLVESDDGKVKVQIVAGALEGKSGKIATQTSVNAYIIDIEEGGVYDVTESRVWQRGSHFAKHQAGCDLTAMIANAPHNEEWILGMPRVGDLVIPSTPARPSPAERLFLFMTYFNLVNVILVILILVLWRWW